MIRRWLILLIIVFMCGHLEAQKHEHIPINRHTTHSTLFGIGGSNWYDTYLSPISYRGPHLSILHETLRRTHWCDGRISTQSITDGHLGYTSNPSGTAHEIGGMLNYTVGWHYNWLLPHSIRLMLGGELHAGLGAVYNNRNSNNPVQAKAEMNVGTSFIAIYPFHIKEQPFTIRYQFSLPLIGAMFSPQYGQSYYELSQTGYNHNICATYPGNAPSMRHLLTIDFPIARFTFRMGYLCDIKQSHVNGIKSHTWNHSFMVGYVKHFSFVKRREPQHHSFIM